MASVGVDVVASHGVTIDSSVVEAHDDHGLVAGDSDECWEVRASEVHVEVGEDVEEAGLGGDPQQEPHRYQRNQSSALHQTLIYYQVYIKTPVFYSINLSILQMTTIKQITLNLCPYS